MRRPAAWLLLAIALLLPGGLDAQDEEGLRFATRDLYVDAGFAGLSAYQLEVRLEAGDGGAVRLVGVEGNAELPFQDPPFYDPRALREDRVVLAGFTTAAAGELPRGAARVATLHLEVEGPAPRLDVRLQAAGDASGTRADARAWSTGGE